MLLLLLLLLFGIAIAADFGVDVFAPPLMLLPPSNVGILNCSILFTNLPFVDNVASSTDCLILSVVSFALFFICSVVSFALFLILVSISLVALLIEREASHANCSDFILALILALWRDDRIVWDAVLAALAALLWRSWVAVVAKLFNFDRALSAAVGEEDDSDDDLLVAAFVDECDDDGDVDLLENCRNG